MYFLKALFLYLWVSLLSASASKENIDAYNKAISKPVSEAIVAQSTPFGTLYILENKPYRVFAIDDPAYLQSVVNMDDPTELPLEYARTMMLALLYPPQVQKVMVIGLGGGQISTYLATHMPALQIVSVDINPDVLEIAQKYMGYRQNQRQWAIAADALDVLRDPQKFHAPLQYNIIFMDAFSAADIPEQLHGVAFWKLLKSRLLKGGVVVQNVIHQPEQMIQELRAVFDNVDFYDAYMDDQLVAIAYDGPKKDFNMLMRRAENFQKRFKWRYMMPRLLESTTQLRGTQKAILSAALASLKPGEGTKNG